MWTILLSQIYTYIYPYIDVKYIHTFIHILMYIYTWWHHEVETFSALLALCAGNSPVFGEFPAQRPVTRSFDVFFDLHLNERLSKQSWGWWFEMLSCSLWRHYNDTHMYIICPHSLRWGPLAPPEKSHCLNRWGLNKMADICRHQFQFHSNF